VQLPERPYALLTDSERATEYEQICRELSGAHTELAEIKIQHNWLYLRGYKDSTETSVSGRERDAEMASVAIREDEFRLEGQISSLTVIRDLLVLLGI
jgi:hypothetical protein